MKVLQQDLKGFVNSWSSLVAQWVKDQALSLTAVASVIAVVWV